MQMLSQSIKQYLEMCKYERNLSADTLKAYQIDLRQFLEFTKGEWEWNNVVVKRGLSLLYSLSRMRNTSPR